MIGWCESRLQRSLPGATGVVLTLLLASSLGCGSGGLDTAPVKGKVMYQGQPVTGGALVFTPVGGNRGPNAGKTGAGVVQTDGSFVVGTYATSDGAVIGSHRLTYTPPVMELPAGKTLQPGESTPPSPYDGLVPKQTNVDVTKGRNTFDVELVASGGSGAPGLR